MLGTWALGIATAVAVGADDDVAPLRAGAWRGHHVVNGRYAMAYVGPVELYLGRGPRTSGSSTMRSPISTRR